MSDKVRRLRERIVRTPVNRRGRRQYDEVLRQEVANYAASRHAVGESYSNIAEALQLPSATLLRWRDRAPGLRRSKERPVGFRPISLLADEPEKTKELEARSSAAKSSAGAVEPVSQPVVVLPSGIRIEGMAVGDLVELVQGLGCLS